MKAQIACALVLVTSMFGCISRPREDVRGQNKREIVKDQLSGSTIQRPQDRISETIRIPFIHENGVLHVQASINGSPIKFVFDSGASDVTISVTEVSYLLKNDFLRKEDFTGQQNYVDANGDVNVGVTFNVSEMRLGPALLNDVNASVVNSHTASNLLGQSALERFGKVSIDYASNEIVLEPK